MSKIALVKKIACLLLALIFLSKIVSSQTGKTIQGSVTNDKGVPLNGVSVLVKGTSHMTLSDKAGKFKILAPDTATLIFSHVGMTTIETSLRGRSSISISMKAKTTDLEDVVVIGYGTIRKKDLTGSVASVKGEDIAKTAVTSFQQGLQGRVSGVQVVQGDATPGGGAYIQIRGISSMLGSNEPLYVVDGVPMNITTSGGTTSEAGLSNTNPLATISPSDIASVEVLKDASATAIYGSQGANGVIMITTKKGQSGRSSVTFNTTQSVSKLSHKIDVLNAREYAEYQNEGNANKYPYNPASTWPWPLNNTDSTKLSPDQLEKLVGKGIDWQDQIYRPAYVQDYNLSFLGGNQNTTYSVMLSYLDQQGILKNSGFKRGGVRINLDQRINNAIKLVSTVSYTRSTNKLVKTSTSDGSSVTGGVVRKALTYSPIPAFQRDSTNKIIGISSDSPDNWDQVDPNFGQNWGATPLRYLQESQVLQTLNNINGSVGLQIQLAKGLQFKPRVGGTFYLQQNDNYFPRTLNEGKNVGGLAQVANTTYSYLITENLLTYQYVKGKQRIDAMGGFTYEQYANRYNGMSASGFADDNIGYWDLSTATLTNPTQSRAAKWSLMSFFGRVNYNYLDRYLFTYTIRTDGSSKFAEGNKWATFQSGAFAWRVDQEKFLRNITWLSNLKFRLSYGQSGNQGLSPYQSLSNMQANTAVIGGSLQNGYSETSQANLKLKWETTNQFNAGIDFGAWANRFTFSANYYNKLTQDLLQTIVSPPSSGFTSKVVNSGKIRNSGVEFEVGVVPVLTQKIRWNISGNIAYNNNKILALSSGVTKQFSPTLGSAYGLNIQPFVQQVGESIGAIYGYVTDGIFQNQQEVNAFKAKTTDASVAPQVGVMRFKDLDNSGTIDANDQMIIGHTIPPYTYGFNNTFTYKAFSLGIFLNGVWGNDIINTGVFMPMKLTGNGGDGNIPLWLYKQAWRGEGTSTTQRQINNNNAEFKRFMPQFLSSGSYLRVGNISIEYAVSTKKNKTIKGLKIGLNAINPFIATQYNGYSPEVSANSSAMMRGVDLGSYPQAKTYSVNVNVTF